MQTTGDDVTFILVNEPEPPSGPYRGKGLVAELSPQEISKMGRAEMIAMVRAAQLPFCPHAKLARLDRDGLRRLVYAVRRYCRGQGY